MLLTVMFAATCLAADVRQKRFPTPEQAAQALVEASRTDDLKGMLAILGPGSRELIFSGDAVADNAGRDRFVAAYEQKHPHGPLTCLEWTLTGKAKSLTGEARCGEDATQKIVGSANYLGTAAQ